MFADQDKTRPGANNPFTPDFGIVPPHLAGRQEILSALLRAFDSQNRDPNLTSIFVGARGTGKTALLSLLGSEAEDRGWVTANVTAEEGMLEDILQRTAEASSHLLGASPKRRISSIEIDRIGTISWEHTDADAPNWRSKMNAVLDGLEETGSGLLITVDEVDPSVEEMSKLATTYQHFVREGRRVGLLMAGLPHNVSGLIAGKKTSFLRRAAQYRLGSISDVDISETFRITLRDAGRAIDEKALKEAVTAIGGFPFMLQLVGYRLWETSQDGTFSAGEVERAATLAQSDLRHRVLDATLRELSDADVEFLCAMLPDEGASAPSDIASRLGKPSAHVSIYKKRLLESGVIEETVRHKLRFCLPGFREYLADTANE